MLQNFNNCPLTLNTTRICASNSVTAAINVTQIGFTHMKPNAVILVNKNEIFDAIAASALVHFPINAAMLYTDGQRLSRETLMEIQRLSLKGYNGIQVILVGNISHMVASELNSYGFKTKHITGHNHYETACNIPAERKEFKNILLVSGEDYFEGISAPYWSAHHGDPILFVQGDKIPACTLEAIKSSGNVNLYIIGSFKTVAKAVETSLSKLPNVKNIGRVSGDNPYEIAVNFAKYKDKTTDFGWDRNYREGHAFTFGTLNHPMETIAGLVFAHMGKHSPLLLTMGNMVPPVVENYIEAVKPMPPKDMPKPPFMHGFILGDISQITYGVQVKLESLLSIDHEMMDMEHSMMMEHLIMDHNSGESHEDMMHGHMMHNHSDEDHEDMMHHHTMHEQMMHHMGENHESSPAENKKQADSKSNSRSEDWTLTQNVAPGFKAVPAEEILD